MFKVANRAIFSRQIHKSASKQTKFEPTFTKPSFKTQTQEPQKPLSKAAQLYNSWLELSFKTRMYLCISTFIIAWGTDYVSEIVFERAQITEEAHKMAEEEFKKLKEKK